MTDLTAQEKAVFGHDAKKDANGNIIEQGLGNLATQAARRAAEIARSPQVKAVEAAVTKGVASTPINVPESGAPAAVTDAAPAVTAPAPVVEPPVTPPPAPAPVAPAPVPAGHPGLMETIKADVQKLEKEIEEIL